MATKRELGIAFGLIVILASIAIWGVVSNLPPAASSFNNVYDDKTPNQNIPIGVVAWGSGHYFYFGSNPIHLKGVRINLEGTLSDSEVIRVAVTTVFGTIRHTSVGATGNLQYQDYPDLSNSQTIIKTYTVAGENWLSSDELNSLNKSGIYAVYISASTLQDHKSSVTVKATVEI